MDIEKIRRTENGRADALAGIAASLPIKEAILLPIHVQANPSVRKASTCNTIEAKQADAKSGRTTLQGTSGQALCPRIPNRHTRSGCPWPFAQWGMDIVDPSSRTRPKKFLLVATDYFSKWVEAEAYASIKDKDVTKGHKQDLITALKKRLEQAKGKWVEELPGILWAYRTTPGRPTGNTPFALAYGMDAIIPTEIGRSKETASIRMADYQQRASAHYNRKIPPSGVASPPPQKGHLVLRLMQAGVRRFLPALCLSKLCPESLVVLSAADKLASASPVSSAASLHCFCARDEGLRIVSGPQQVRKQMCCWPCREDRSPAAEKHTNKKNKVTNHATNTSVWQEKSRSKTIPFPPLRTFLLKACNI
ncbi:hypothetical protein CK203_006621 [Vitis vinifera]|uniref:Integrase catalytic domain-containing protein n=1 Tax=Vitis vinifera TaxID=29760 RepID=A0A438KAX3_VITVI|nr:hypothetical protein CK203_006621 [Vitis vinifera]